jgi:nucleoside-diphosphate-sugar epimerase
MRKDVILVTGANGQIGSVLTKALRNVFGQDEVLATDIRKPEKEDGPFEMLDILNKSSMQQLIKKYRVTQIYHLAAILSAKGEANPQKTWKINMDGFFNIMESAREFELKKVFFPSSIAVFCKETPRQKTPQHTVSHPETVYGISKSASENWCQYYYQKYGLDVRSVRYPGIISYQSAPGGGTTDYAVEIYHEALNRGKYQCFLKEDMRLPMIYMPDAIRATLMLMDAPASQITIRTSYNLAAMSFTPKELYQSILKHIPNFKISYKPDYRQEIAESWNESIDDSFARNDWGWNENFDIDAMTKDMILNLKKKNIKDKSTLVSDLS